MPQIETATCSQATFKGSNYQEAAAKLEAHRKVHLATFRFPNLTTKASKLVKYHYEGIHIYKKRGLWDMVIVRSTYQFFFIFFFDIVTQIRYYCNTYLWLL